MSHSLKDPNRAWDAGMKSDDFISFIKFEKANESPINWVMASPIHFIRVRDMRDSFDRNLIRITKPKGVEEGSEIRVIWPSTTANEDAVVTEIDEKYIKLSYILKKGQQRCQLTRKNFSLSAQCKVGEHVKKNQIIASTVPILFNPPCQKTVDESYFQEALNSVSLSDRYASAKALRFRGYKESTNRLHERMVDPAENIYVQLEAAAALAAYENNDGWDFLTKSLNSSYLNVQLETVIVISEIKNKKSEKLLMDVLTDTMRDSEIRAGAAWALGNFVTHAAVLSLIDTFNTTNQDIKIEAARALLKIAPSQVSFIEDLFINIDNEKRDGIAWTLAHSDGIDLFPISGEKVDDSLRLWSSYIAGYGKDHLTEEQLSQLCKNDPEVYFAASVLWQILSSWINDLREY